MQGAKQSVLSCVFATAVQETAAPCEQELQPKVVRPVQVLCAVEKFVCCAWCACAAPGRLATATVPLTGFYQYADVNLNLNTSSACI